MTITEYEVAAATLLNLIDVAYPEADSAIRDADVRRAMRRLMVRRMALGLPQRRIAELLGTQQSHISDWETGKTIPQADGLAKYARALGLRLALVESATGESAAK
jgi:ribosome-binding protein aMBF1 (putative translation factor)